MMNAALFSALMASGMAFGPALAQACPIWDAFTNLMCEIPGMVDAWIAAANAINSPAFNLLFEMIFS